MSRSPKRMLNRLLIILIILILILLVLLLVKRSRDAAPSNTGSTSDSTAVSQPEAEEVNPFRTLSYTTEERALAFSLGDDGVWYWESDRDFPLDTTVIDSIMQELSAMTPVRTITESDTMEAYGLDEVTMTVSAQQKDGTEIRLFFGDQVSDSTNYYMLNNNDADTVYVVSNAIPSRLGTAIYDMMALPEFPKLPETEYSSVTIRGDVETVLVAFEHSSEHDAAKPPAVSWLCNGEDVSENARLKSLIAAISSMKLGTCENFKPSDKAVTLWGLDAPAVTAEINYGTDQRLTLHIGSQTLDGGGYYLRINDDTTIYSMSNDMLKPLLTVAESGLTGAEKAAAVPSET